MAMNESDADDGSASITVGAGDVHVTSAPERDSEDSTLLGQVAYLPCGLFGDSLSASNLC